MSLSVDGVLVGSAHAPGGGQGCAPMGPVISDPPPPQQVTLTAGAHTLDISATTNDALYHFGAFINSGYPSWRCAGTAPVSGDGGWSISHRRRRLAILRAAASRKLKFKRAVLDADPFPESIADGALDSLHFVKLVCGNDDLRPAVAVGALRVGRSPPDPAGHKGEDERTSVTEVVERIGDEGKAARKHTSNNLHYGEQHIDGDGEP